MGAHCRIEVEPRQQVGETRYVATMSAVDPETHRLRPLVAGDGARLMFSAESEPLAFNSALAFLEQRFGGFSEIAYGCGKPHPAPLPDGPPLVLQDV